MAGLEFILVSPAGYLLIIAPFLGAPFAVENAADLETRPGNESRTANSILGDVRILHFPFLNMHYYGRAGAPRPTWNPRPIDGNVHRLTPRLIIT